MKTTIERFTWFKVYTNLTQKDIAEKMGVSASHLSRLKKEPEYDKFYQEHIEEFKKENWEDISQLSRRAVKSYNDLFDQIDEGKVQDTVVVSAIKDVLDRTGYKVKEQHDVKIDMGTSTTDIAKYVKDNYED